MSFDLIDHTLTTSTTDSKGVVTWSNPAVKDTINSKGEVFSKYGKKKVKMASGCYNMTLVGVKGSCPASFNSMFSRMVLGIKLQGNTLKKKSNAVWYLPENMKVVPLTETNLKRKQKVTHKQLTLNTNTQEFEMDADNKQYYTLHKAKNEHITEDGAVFPTRELAEWHQNNVSKGKGNAQIVLDYNGGYILAEQIFLQEVKYNKKQPYVNFVDVMNNNKGIVSNVQEEHCVFDKLDSKYGFHSDVCFMSLRKGIPDKVSKHQAIKIQEALEQYSNAVESLGSSVTRLESLLKQIK